jgi:cytoskeletal protein CcmA (bactofilin family)
MKNMIIDAKTTGWGKHNFHAHLHSVMKHEGFFNLGWSGDFHFPGHVLIQRDLGAVLFKGNFTCRGNLTVEEGTKFFCSGTVSCGARLSADEIVVAGDLKTGRSLLAARRLKTGGDMVSRGEISTGQCIAALGGSILAAKGIQASKGSIYAQHDICCGGSLDADSEISADGKINVMGDIFSEKSVQSQFGIKAGRYIKCYGGITTESGDVSAGSMIATGEFGPLMVKGSVRTGASIPINSIAKIEGDLVAAKDIYVDGCLTCKGQVLAGEKLVLSGRIEAKAVSAQNNALEKFDRLERSHLRREAWFMQAYKNSMIDGDNPENFNEDDYKAFVTDLLKRAGVTT